MSRPAKYCTECEKYHTFPIPKFNRGDKVRICGFGYHHNDKIGWQVFVLEVATFLIAPCDDVEYIISTSPEGFHLEGNVLERRLIRAE